MVILAINSDTLNVRGHPRLSEFSAYPNGPSLNRVQPVRIVKDALYLRHSFN